jgi:hypothetical protein
VHIVADDAVIVGRGLTVTNTVFEAVAEHPEALPLTV